MAFKFLMAFLYIKGIATIGIPNRKKIEGTNSAKTIW
jgi:hypothetical protein